MTIEKVFRGSYRISAMFHGTLIVKDYYYYSKKESVALFKKALREMQARIDTI